MSECIKLCEHCDGCGLCANVCPNDAIELVQNNKGFYYATISKTCIKCGKCVNAIQLKCKKGSISRQIYAAKHLNENVVINSSSGGVFTAISDYVIKKSGKIYGVVFNRQFEVEHISVTASNERNNMRGSKYVQSKVGLVYRDVLKDLMDGKNVLFTGTPCQIDALNSFLNSKKCDKDKLVTCEVICNGVSSPKLWKRYINEYIGLNRIERVWFRFKNPSICGSIFAVRHKSGWIDTSGYYSRLYTSNNCYNNTCYSCRYAKMERYSDLTIGDFQGESGTTIKIDNTHGLSVVMVNTQKGEKIWEHIKGDLIYQEIFEGYKQDRLVAPCEKPKSYDRFWIDENRLSIRKLLKKYTKKKLIEDLRAMKTSFRLK